MCKAKIAFDNDTVNHIIGNIRFSCKIELIIILMIGRSVGIHIRLIIES